MNNFLIKNTLKILIITLIASLIISCENRGCIEADDFGEYNSYNLEVYANNFYNLCKYDPTKTYNDNSQGILFKKYFETNCLSLQTNGEILNCAFKVQSYCQFIHLDEEFLRNNGIMLKSEPLWVSTKGPLGLTIEEESNILIKTSGQINLGGSLNSTPAIGKYDDIGKYDVQSYDSISASFTNSPSDQLLVQNNKAKYQNNSSVYINFWGNYSSFFPRGNEAQYQVSSSKTSTQSNYYLNYANPLFADGGRQIFAYTFPKLSSNYPDNDSVFFINPLSWNCRIVGDGIKNLECSYDDDNDNYSLVESFTGSLENTADKFNTEFNNLYQISNKEIPAGIKASSRFINNTGFIRYKNDGFQETKETPNDYNILLIENSNLSGSNWFQINPPNRNIDYEVRFDVENSNSNPNCTRDNFKYTISAVNSQIDLPDISSDPFNSFTLSKANISEFKIKYTQSTVPDGCSMKIYFYPYEYIDVEKSGYIYFDYVNKFNTDFFPGRNGQSSIERNSCKFTYEIINQDNSIELVESDATLSERKFVRKGQKIKINPKSWNNTWTINKIASPRVSYTFKCNEGLFSHLIPRPAVFCSNKKLKELVDVNSDDDIQNDCEAYYDAGSRTVTGCKEKLQDCGNILLTTGTVSINTNFCPSECINTDYINSNCRRNFDESTGSYLSPSSCDLDPATNTNLLKCQTQTCSGVAGCKNFIDFASQPSYKSQLESTAFKAYNPSYTSSQASTYFNDVYCKNCINNKIKAEIITKPKFILSQPLVQCYDLEEYTGSLSELNAKINDINNAGTIPNAGSNIDPLVIFKDKNLKKLKSFDGEYGNLYPFEYSGETYINSTQYSKFKTRNLGSFTNNGFIKFLLLKSDYIGNYDFNSISTYSTTPLTDPPLRFSLEEIQTKFNGEKMSIALCKESSANGNDCESDKTETEIIDTFGTNNHRIISINSSLSVHNNYEFDTGILVRKTNKSTSTSAINNYTLECENSSIGDNYICFKNPNNRDSPKDYTFGNKYRLAFKIIDEENSNCKFNSTSFVDCPSSDSSCNMVKMANPNYDNSSTGYCPKVSTFSLDQISCKNQFYCVDKFANNSGKYDVQIMIKRKSLQSISRFINSIISPVLGQVDGYDYEVDKDYIQNYDVLSKISTARFNFQSETIQSQDNANFLKQNVYINNGGSSTNIDGIIAELKALDSRIVGHKTYKSSGGIFKIDLREISGNEKFNNLIISYIGMTAYSTPSTSDAVVDFKKCPYDIANAINLVQEKCLFRSSCNFTVNDEDFPVIITPSSVESDCSATKSLAVSIIYSTPTKKLQQDNFVKSYYQKLAKNTTYRTILTMSVVLMFSFYGLGYLIGVSELKQSEIIDRLIKIGIIYIFCDPNYGWVWFEKFFVDGFKGGADFLTFTMASLFDDSEAIRTALNQENYVDKSPLFMSADRVIGLFVSNETIHKKISGLLFYNLFGVIYLYIIYLSIFNYIYAISNSVLLYLTAQVFTSVLFMLAPIFFLFILFKQTRTFFDNWTNSIIGFALQQIFLVFTISLFNVFIYNLVKTTLGFRVCWDTIWRITSMAGSLSLFSFWTVSDAPSFLNQTQAINFKGDFNRTSPSFPMIISLWSVTLLMKSFVNQITDLVSLMTGGIQASTLGSGIRGGMNKLQNELSGKLNKYYQKTGIKSMVERADKKLFNSGAQAKVERAKEKEQQKNDRELRNKMLKSANKAEKEFKINNLKSDNRLSGNDLNKKLQEVRKDAMMKKAMSKGIGKDSDQMKKLMKSSNTIDEKGRITMPKTDNVFNAARMMVQNLASDRGGYINLAKDVASGIKNMANNPAGALKNMVSSPTESLKGALKSDTLETKAKKVDNAISEKDAKKALKDLDPDKRDKLMNDIKASPNPNNNNQKIEIKPSDKDKSNAENRLQAYVNKQNQKDRE